MQEKKRVTIYDIAKELNISVGTVNRALNNKPRISEETKQRVLEVAKRMNFKVNSVAQSLRRNPIYIGAVLYCPVPQYLNDIKRGMDSAFDELKEFNVFGDIRIITDESIDERNNHIIGTLEEFRVKKYACVAMFLSGNNSELISIISQMKEEGVVFATVANDILGSESVISVSADGHCAGMLAAEFLHLCCQNGKVAIMTGSIKTPIHKENIDGFYSYAGKNSFQSIILYEHQDSTEQAILKTKQMLSELPDIGGLYITSAISPVICDVIRQSGYDRKIKIIATDLFSEIKDLLNQKVISATIFQDPYKQGKDVVKRLYQYNYDKHRMGKYLIIPQIIFSSNMNMYS